MPLIRSLLSAIGMRWQRDIYGWRVKIGPLSAGTVKVEKMYRVVYASLKTRRRSYYVSSRTPPANF